MVRTGVHLSIAGGMKEVLARARQRDCQAFQVFASNPRTWRHGPVREAGDAEYVSGMREAGLGPVILHTIYLMNLATYDSDLLAKSIDALVYSLRRAAVLGSEFIVTHLGSISKDVAEAEGALAMAGATRRVAAAISEGIRTFLESPEGAPDFSKPTLLLENSAGAGRSVGGDFADIQRIMSLVRDDFSDGSVNGLQLPEIGVCLDTCHVHAAGYDLALPHERERLTNDISSTVGLPAIRAMHGNDCKGPAGSHLDRHEHIGEGSIGVDGFSALLNHPHFSSLPWVLETPGDIEDDLRNLATVRKLSTK